MEFVPENRRRQAVWCSVPPGSPGALELRMVYLEFELERRLVAHEQALEAFLRSRRVP